MDYEYCVMMDRYPEPHRVPPEREYETDEPITDQLEWCKEWMRYWDEAAPTARPGVFYIARRPVGNWEKYEV